MEEIYKSIVLSRFPAPGNIFFVDGVNGSNANAGDKPTSAYLTLTYALAQCTADRNDIIFVLDYWQAAGESWPITINKNAVHIIGLAQGNLPYPAIHPTGDTAAFQLTSSGQYGSIENLTIGGGNAHGGIDWLNEGQVDGFLIKNCWFGHQWFGTPISGILQPTGSSRGGFGNRIEKCRFLGDLANCTGAITGNAIDMLGTVASYDLEIVDCVFMGCAIAINLTKCHNSRIINNNFACPDAADGEAVSLLASCLGNWVNNNYAGNGGDAAMTKEPYRDVAATNKNHWGVNWTTNAVDLPKQA